MLMEIKQEHMEVKEDPEAHPGALLDALLAVKKEAIELEAAEVEEVRELQS